MCETIAVIANVKLGAINLISLWPRQYLAMNQYDQKMIIMCVMCLCVDVRVRRRKTSQNILQPNGPLRVDSIISCSSHVSEQQKCEIGR